MGDYIPQADGDLDVWAQNFKKYISDHPGEFGLAASDVTPVVGAVTTWSAAFTTHTAAQGAASSARLAKDAAREALVNIIRELVRGIQAKSSVTDAARAAIGITIKDGTPTLAAVPTTAPVAKVNTSKRLEHTIEFMDSATPTSKAKPAGVRGCQIWVKVGGPPPASASELHYLATDTRSPYVSQYDGTDAGKQAHYWLRWENTHQETGPWSACVSATIAG